MEDLVVVEVSEGLGTGIFVNGAIARGKDGMAGEFGHIQMIDNGPRCNCGNHGCWETLASNNAAVHYYSTSPGAQKHIAFSKILRLALSQDKVARLHWSEWLRTSAGECAWWQPRFRPRRSLWSARLQKRGMRSALS
jgi:predicted NBD/HSP70 family sugar kinase